MRSITDIVRQFKQDWTEQLCPENIERACRDCGITWIESTLNPVVTIQLFLLQVMHGNTACTHLPHLARMTFTGAAYCKARMRVKLDAFKLLVKRCADAVQTEAVGSANWLGHRVFFVDGSSFSMPDTAELRDFFGHPTGQKPGCAFPVAHWLVMMHMGTGMITKMFGAPMRTGDLTRIAELHPELKAGDVLVADRGFCSFPHLCLLAARGVEAVLRIHQKTIVDFTPGRPHRIPGRRRNVRVCQAQGGCEVWVSRTTSSYG